MRTAPNGGGLDHPLRALLSQCVFFSLLDLFTHSAIARTPITMATSAHINSFSDPEVQDQSIKISSKVHKGNDQEEFGKTFQGGELDAPEYE